MNTVEMHEEQNHATLVDPQLLTDSERFDNLILFDISILEVSDFIPWYWNPSARPSDKKGPFGIWIPETMFILNFDIS